ncbi:hypothetical protein ACXJJ3_37040 [Kribbella sp. WER1]
MQTDAHVNGSGNDWFTGGNDWFTGGNDWFRGGNDWFVPTIADDGNDW